MYLVVVRFSFGTLLSKGVLAVTIAVIQPHFFVVVVTIDSLGYKKQKTRIEKYGR